MKLLIVVDYQNDFVDGALGFEKAKALESKLVLKIEETIQNGGIVAFTLDTHQDYYLETREGKALPVEHCMMGTAGRELHGEVKEMYNKYLSDHVVTTWSKNTFGLEVGAGYGSHRKIVESASEIEICGVATNICVTSVAINVQTVAYDTPITIDASCCASFNDELHEKALDVLEGLQFNVINREVQ